MKKYPPKSLFTEKKENRQNKQSFGPQKTLRLPITETHCHPLGCLLSCTVGGPNFWVKMALYSDIFIVSIYENCFEAVLSCNMSLFVVNFYHIIRRTFRKFVLWTLRNQRKNLICFLIFRKHCFFYGDLELTLKDFIRVLTKGCFNWLDYYCPNRC